MIEAEWLIVADYAKVADGKLTMVGAGTSTFQTRYGEIRLISVATRLRVDTAQANQDFSLEFDFLDMEGRTILPPTAGRASTLVVMGPPERFKDWPYQYVLSAYAFYGIPIIHAGGYDAVVLVDGEIKGRTTFQVTG